MDSWVWIPGFGVLDLDSWFGFMALDSKVLISLLGVLSVDAWLVFLVWIPRFGFLGLGAWAWSPCFGVTVLGMGY